jgi:hypothetical protein
MLLSAGGFAVYLAESNVFNLLAPYYGDLSRRENREKLLAVWLKSKLFRATGLDSNQIEAEILENARNAGDFLRLVMDSIVHEQDAQRWAENSPEGTLHLPLIKQLIPDALIIHMTRDGRDVAMSLHHTRYVRPFFWQDRISLVGAGIYWEWIVEHGRNYGRQLGTDYMEARFEDLIASPQSTLDAVGQFIDQKLDYKRIREIGYGSVSKPNTSFRGESRENFNPIGRWKKGFSPEELERFERIVGPTLTALGYATTTEHAYKGMTVEMHATRYIYRAYFESKLRLKRNALYHWLRPLTPARIDANTLGENHPPQLKTFVSSQSPDGVKSL